MDRSREEKLRNPPRGSRIAAARDYGIDLTLLIENLRLTPAERIKKNDAVVNSLIRVEAAVRQTKPHKK